MPSDPRRGASMNPLLTRLGRALVASLLLLARRRRRRRSPPPTSATRTSPTPAASAVTGSKPESKLWYNDGFWWAQHAAVDRRRFFIYKLDPSTDTWVSTGVALDNRNGTRADTLWDGTKLYVASQNFSRRRSRGPVGDDARLYRFSYNGSTDTTASTTASRRRCAASIRSETLVIAKDSTGMLWATWTQNTSAAQPPRLHEPHRERQRRRPGRRRPILPVGSQGVGVTTDADDISTIIAFTVGGEHRIGVFWSNQADAQGLLRLARRRRRRHDRLDRPRPRCPGPSQADDHMNIKTDSSGQVYASSRRA